MQSSLDLSSVLILASKSPRRRYLLRQVGLSFRVVPSGIDETGIFVSKSSPADTVKARAEAKANDIAKKYPQSWVIGADTIVLIENMILGKPASLEEARRMLKQLNGKTHQVLTGYAIFCRLKNRSFSDTVSTQVLFKNLSDKEIEWYIHTQEPFDKAGAYAIQGLGSFLVKGISGSYTNVVGLPVCEVVDCLIREGVVKLRIGNGKDLAALKQEL